MARTLEDNKVAVPVPGSGDMLLETRAGSDLELGFTSADLSPVRDPVVFKKEVDVKQEDGSYATVYSAYMRKLQQGKEEFVISSRDLLDFTTLGAPDFDVEDFDGTINATVVVKRDLVIGSIVIPGEASDAASINVTVPIAYFEGN